jgi:hypothetical protein
MSFVCVCVVAQIFTERSEEMMLPPDKVLPHLQALSASLVTPYLEFLMDRGEKEAVFHNELVFNYLDTIIKLKQDPSYKSSTPPHTTRHTRP